MHDYSQFVDWVFTGVLSGGVIVGVNILSKLRDSVERLNTNVAIIIDKVDRHESNLDSHEERIRALEFGNSI